MYLRLGTRGLFCLVGRQTRFWVRHLHAGEALGLVGQTLSALAAGGALFLVYTGFALSGRRFFSKRPQSIP